MPLLTILKGFNEHWHKTHEYTLDPLLDPVDTKKEHFCPLFT